MSKPGATLKPYDSGGGVWFGRAGICEFSIYAIFRKKTRHAQKSGWFLSVAPGLLLQSTKVDNPGKCNMRSERVS